MRAQHREPVDVAMSRKWEVLEDRLLLDVWLALDINVPMRLGKGPDTYDISADLRALAVQQGIRTFDGMSQRSNDSCVQRIRSIITDVEQFQRHWDAVAKERRKAGKEPVLTCEEHAKAAEARFVSTGVPEQKFRFLHLWDTLRDHPRWKHCCELVREEDARLAEDARNKYEAEQAHKEARKNKHSHSATLPGHAKRKSSTADPTSTRPVAKLNAPSSSTFERSGRSTGSSVSTVSPLTSKTDAAKRRYSTETPSLSSARSRSTTLSIGEVEHGHPESIDQGIRADDPMFGVHWEVLNKREEDLPEAQRPALKAMQASVAAYYAERLTHPNSGRD